MSSLKVWKSKPNRKPLILRGVRQAGKTFLLKQFGQESFDKHYVVNFEKQEGARALFNGDLVPARIIEELQFFLGTRINIDTDLVVFDEIQACPRALTSLKYFCEDMPRLALCSAGSLLGLRLSEGSYPVGKVDMLHLYPLTFSEFLAGIGDDMSADILAGISAKSPPSAIGHAKLWERLKHYFVTGGLPEVVTTFAEHQDSLYVATGAVRIKQEELINAYYADIAKHSGKVNAMHIDRAWRAVPIQLSRTEDSSPNRFRFKGIVPGVNRFAQLAHVIDWLEAAELVMKVAVVETSQQPLMAYAKENIFKLLIFDIGILGAMGGLDPKTILNYDYGTYKGYFAENFVAQQLLASGFSKLVTWQEDRSEVEFLVQHEGDIIPIEVKSGNVTRARSLHKYSEKYLPNKSIILSAQNLSIDEKNRLFRLPLYLAEQVFNISNP